MSTSSSRTRTRASTILRHSASHFMAHAVLELFPGTRGRDRPRRRERLLLRFSERDPLHPPGPRGDRKEDAGDGLPATSRSRKVTQDEPRPSERFKGLGQNLKVELIEEKGGETVSTATRRAGFIDFCLGPHVPSTGYIKHFKLLSVSGAYWKGDERGQQLQRIYGTVFYDKRQLKDYLAFIEEAKERDHRRLGVELDLLQLQRRRRRRSDPLAPQGRPDPRRHRGLLAEASLRGRLRNPLHAAHRPGEPLADLGPSGFLQGLDVLAHGHRRDRTTTSSR